MVEKLDKAKKKAMLEAWGKQNREVARAKFPLANTLMNQFFESFNALMDKERLCFHDFRHAEAAIAKMQLTEKEANCLLDWCADNGGYCDCEILHNAEQAWQENQ